MSVRWFFVRRGWQLLLIVFLVFGESVFLEADSSHTGMQWQDATRDNVVVSSLLEANEAKGCLDAGLELEHRFLLKFCEKVNRFGTHCGPTKRVINTFSSDPIQETYVVKKDRLGDVEGPLHFSHKEFSDALDDASKIGDLPLRYLGGEKAFERFHSGDGHWNLGVRVRTTCKGDVPKFLADVSYILTFGLVDLYGNDTGWEYYNLDGTSTE